MYSVELYARVRHACHVEGMSIREAARAFWFAPGHGAQDAAVFDTARVSAESSPGEAEAGSVYGCDRPHRGGGPEVCEETASHSQADLREAARRARFHGRLQHREGLRAGAAVAVPGDVRSPGPPTRPMARRILARPRRRLPGWRGRYRFSPSICPTATWVS